VRFVGSYYVGTMNCTQPWQPRKSSRFPLLASDVCLLRNVHTGSETSSYYHFMSTGESFPRGNVAGAWRYPPSPPSTGDKNKPSIHSPSPSPYGRHREEFTVTTFCISSRYAEQYWSAARTTFVVSNPDARHPKLDPFLSSLSSL
jgi:hypothetical protein